MARQQRICVCCGEPIGTDEKSVPYKGRYAHEKCFNVAMKAIKKDKNEKLEAKTKEKTKKVSTKKPKAELKDAVSEKEYQEKQKYYKYLRGLITDGLSAKVYALTDEYIRRYDFTFKDMYQTLVYLHEIIEKDLIGDVVGLIPYYYTQAQQYYQSVEDVAEKNKDIDASNMYQQKIIYIRPETKKIKQIDMTSIGKEDTDE